jgi:hypothetical protein
MYIYLNLKHLIAVLKFQVLQLPVLWNVFRRLPILVPVDEYRPRIKHTPRTRMRKETLCEPAFNS